MRRSVMAFAAALLLGSAVAAPCAPKAETGPVPEGPPVLQPRAHAHGG